MAPVESSMPPVEKYLSLVYKRLAQEKKNMINSTTKQTLIYFLLIISIQTSLIAEVSLKIDYSDIATNQSYIKENYTLEKVDFYQDPKRQFTTTIHKDWRADITYKSIPLLKNNVPIEIAALFPSKDNQIKASIYIHIIQNNSQKTAMGWLENFLEKNFSDKNYSKKFEQAFKTIYQRNTESTSDRLIAHNEDGRKSISRHFVSSPNQDYLYYFQLLTKEEYYLENAGEVFWFVINNFQPNI